MPELELCCKSQVGNVSMMTENSSQLPMKKDTGNEDTKKQFEESNERITNTPIHTLPDDENERRSSSHEENFSSSNNSASHSFSYDVSRQTIIIEQTYSDGYFNSSIDRLVANYENKENSETLTEEQPTGCFDETKDSANKASKFSRCSQKRLIVTTTTVLCMVIAATAAIILTLNVFTNKYHKHSHGELIEEESAEVYQHYAVSAGSAICSKIGADVLRKDGSAVDAAIASCFCLGIVNKHASGIGGGGYMLVYIRENKTFEALDFASSAPGRARSSMYDDNKNTSKYGSKAIAVPGEVRGLYTAWQKYGKLSWKELVQPAINLTKYGVIMQINQHEIASSMKELLQEDPGLRKLLLTTSMQVHDAGYLLTDEILSKTLENIRDKPDTFYYGNLAEKIVRDISFAGGIITLDDLANYKVRVRKVVTNTVNSLKLNTIGAPTGGPLVTQILNILEGYHFMRQDIETKEGERSALTIHRLIEAMKFAYAQRTKEGDPDYNDIETMKQLVSNMTDEEFGENFREMIDDGKTKDSLFYGPEFNMPTDNGTSHISVIAPNGDAVSMTTTINDWFGCMYRSLDTGIIYNNQMKDFSTVNDKGIPTLLSSHFNSIHGGKRPISSASPIIMTNRNGDVKFVLGGTGGLRGISATAQVIMNKLWFGDQLGQALLRPRFYHFLYPNYVMMEEDSEKLYPDIIKLLRRRDHTTRVTEAKEYSTVHAIYVEDNGEIHAKSDPRSSGHTDGF